MVKATKTAELEPIASDETEPGEVKESSKVAKVYRNGILQREYSLELHGKAFKALANEFATKNHKPELGLKYEVIVK